MASELQEQFDNAKALVTQATNALSTVCNRMLQAAGREEGMLAHVAALQKEAEGVAADIKAAKAELASIKAEAAAVLKAKAETERAISDLKVNLASIKAKIPV